ncbi:MAG TPA: hemolysin family protein [Verrucomicrobiae bacterium]|nr:hemolysin family protein [Verrucomicrobiae bacterium]
MIIFLIACATAVIVSFVCSVLEATLLSLDDVHLEGKRKEGHRYAEVWQNMRKRIDRPIAAILILNTVAHTGGATVAGSAFDEIFGDEWIWLFSVIFTIVVLVGTEIIPKVIGVSYAERLAPMAAPFLSFMTLVLTPIIAVTEWLARPFKRKGGKRRMSISDLRTMADMARHERLISPEEGDIIINATKLRHSTVESVMVPRDRMMLFDARQPNIANFETAASSLHTRYPVSQDGTVEGITGYVNFKEIVAMMPSRREAQIQPFIRPLSRLAAGASLNEALKSLLGRREHMALVEDGEHRIVGLVTLEDLMEEIVGDLTDEFDHLSDEIIEVADRRWKVGGGARLADVLRQTGVHLSAADLSITLCDWLQQRQGREPRVGDSVKEGTVQFTVIQTRRRKANRVLVEAP